MTVELTSFPPDKALVSFSGYENFLLVVCRWDVHSSIVCSTVLVLALWASFVLRMRYVTKRMLETMKRRTEERLRAAEREHDVLLQSIQGLALRFHYVTEALPEDHPSRPMLHMALQRADGLIIEARNRGEELRCDVDNDSSELRKNEESDV